MTVWPESPGFDAPNGTTAFDGQLWASNCSRSSRRFPMGSLIASSRTVAHDRRIGAGIASVAESLAVLALELRANWQVLARARLRPRFGTEGEGRIRAGI